MSCCYCKKNSLDQCSSFPHWSGSVPLLNAVGRGILHCCDRGQLLGRWADSRAVHRTKKCSCLHLALLPPAAEFNSLLPAASSSSVPLPGETQLVFSDPVPKQTRTCFPIMQEPCRAAAPAASPASPSSTAPRPGSSAAHPGSEPWVRSSKLSAGFENKLP